MKILHTSDWHIGQTFFGYDRAEEHRIFLTWLLDAVSQNGIDLLLIAGDIFDSPNPSAESQKIFFSFIKNITATNPQLQIIITSGNHDSAARLEAPNPLLESLNVTVRGVVRHNADGEIDYERLIVPIKEGACCLAVPYLRQGDYPHADSYDAGVKGIYDRLYSIAREKYATIISMGHLQATGSEISIDDRSERTTIGGLDCVSPDFSDSGIIYTALGHLHKSQRVSKRENMRYSGSPLPMSFAERRNRQSVTMVTIENNQARIEKLPFDPPVKLLSIPQSPQPLEEVLAEIEKLPVGEIDDTTPFLEVLVETNGPEPTRRQQIEKALEGKAVRLARIEAVSPPSKQKDEAPLTYEEFKKIEPMELARIIYKQKYNTDEMPDDIAVLLDEVIKEVKA